MRLLPGVELTFTSPLGPIEIRRKLGEYTHQTETIDTSPAPTVAPHFDGVLLDDSFHLVDRRNPSYYGWVEVAGTVTALPASVGGVRISLKAAMHGRTTNFRFGFWSAWLFLLITMLMSTESMPLSGWLWMTLFAAVLLGMHYLDYRSCVRETEFVRRTLQGSEPE